MLILLEGCFKVESKQRFSLNDLSLYSIKILKELIKSNQCQTCNKLLIAKIHCLECSKNICTRCFENHINHKTTEIVNIYGQSEEYKQKLKIKINDLNSRLNVMNLESKNSFLEKQKGNLNLIRSEQEKTIKKNSAMLKELIDELEKDQIELMNSLYGKFFKKMNEFQSEAMKKQSEIKKKIINYHQDSEKDNSNLEEIIKNISFFKKVYSLCENLNIEIGDLEDYVKSNLILWDQQYNSKLEYNKSVCDNLTSNILENITFVKFNSLLKCGKNEEYIINDELILKYLVFS